MSNKFKNIVIATDLDGTFFGSKATLVQRNLDSVKYFCENGGHFTVSTGRLPLFVLRAMPNVADIINMPAVTGNGTCLYDFSYGCTLKSVFMPSELPKRIIDFMDGFGKDITCRVTTADGFIFESLDNKHALWQYEHFSKNMKGYLLPRAEWSDFEVYKVNIIGEKDEIAVLYPHISKEFGEVATVTRSGYSDVEIMPAKTSKARLLRELIDEYFNFPITLCALGDMDNDLEMLRIADIAACPQNANDTVKQICKYCLCPNTEGVVSDLIDILDKTM